MNLKENAGIKVEEYAKKGDKAVIRSYICPFTGEAKHFIKWDCEYDWVKILDPFFIELISQGWSSTNWR